MYNHAQPASLETAQSRIRIDQRNLTTIGHSAYFFSHVGVVFSLASSSLVARPQSESEIFGHCRAPGRWAWWVPPASRAACECVSLRVVSLPSRSASRRALWYDPPSRRASATRPPATVEPATSGRTRPDGVTRARLVRTRAGRWTKRARGSATPLRARRGDSAPSTAAGRRRCRSRPAVDLLLLTSSVLLPCPACAPAPAALHTRRATVGAASHASRGLVVSRLPSCPPCPSHPAGGAIARYR